MHDVIEDGGVSLEDLTWQFGKEVSDLVWAVTGIGNNRKARNQDQYDKLKAYPKAIILKQADRLANGQISAQDPDGSHFKMYKKEYPAFRAELIISGGDTFMWVRLDKLFGYIQ